MDIKMWNIGKMEEWNDGLKIVITGENYES